jgi:hypothetical protein
LGAFFFAPAFALLFPVSETTVSGYLVLTENYGAFKMAKAGNIKNIRMYALAILPFIAFFGYQVAIVLPHRPEYSDLVHGYTIPLGLDDNRTHYISVLDCVLTFVPFLCGMVIIAIGMWRSGVFARSK